MNVRWEVCSRLPPVLSKSLNTPVMKVLKHLILQHNKSWYNKYYTHHSVALHNTADVITNTMQRDWCETDMRDMDKNFELYQAVSNYSLLLHLTLDNIIKQLDNIDESIIESRSPTISIGDNVVGGKTILERFDVLKEEFKKISSLAEKD